MHLIFGSTLFPFTSAAWTASKRRRKHQEAAASSFPFMRSAQNERADFWRIHSTIGQGRLFILGL